MTFLVAIPATILRSHPGEPGRHHLRLPGPITTTARHAILHLPEYWPWATEFSVAHANIRGVRRTG